MKPYPIKALINNEGSGATRVDIFDDIGDGGWGGGGLTAKDFSAQLAGLRGPLEIHINSSGGNVDDGIAIASTIRSYEGPKRTIVDGMAASIASVIMQAGDERIVQPGAMVMVHDAAAGYHGTQAEFEKMAAVLGKHSDNIAEQYAARAGGTAQQWRQTMRDEAWYTADEAVAAGLADRVGAGVAALPRGFDLAALHAVPGRIVAHLRTMPVLEPRNATESAGHGAFTGTHTHPHGAMGSQGADGTHEHEHSHDGDGDHAHSHAATDHVHPHVHAAAFEPKPYKRDDGEDVCCPTCEKYNDVDARYCDQCGAKLVGRDDVTTDGTGPTAAGRQALIAAGLTPEQVAAIVNADGVDESDWDGPHAMSLAAKSEDPAATYKQICAGRRDGEPDKEDSWALPYRYPGEPANRAGVKAALGRLPQTQGLTNAAEAKSLLQRLMKQINPDYEPDDSTGVPAWLTAHHDTAHLPAWLDEAPEEATR